MREIIFRGKTKIGGFWVEGAYVPENKIIIGYFEVEGYDSDEDLTDCKAVIRKVLHETVGQYTGLTDKNGKRIFEGDIVTGYFNHEKILGYIIYGSDATFFIQRDGLYGIGLNNAEDWLSVVGNIHDDPKLLNAERK